jgi:hypothetical protein
MIKGITKDWHGFIDYSYVPIVLAAPKLVGFEDEKWASDFCYALSAAVLGYSLLTDAKWGALKLIPYKTHAVLDFSTGVMALAAPWLLKAASNKKARNTLLLMGISGIVVGTLSLIGAKRG